MEFVKFSTDSTENHQICCGFHRKLPLILRNKLLSVENVFYGFVFHGINGIFSMVSLFMPPKELWEAYSNCTVRPCVRPCVRPAFVSGPYLLYSLRKEFQIRYVNASWDGGVSRTIFGSL